MTPWEMIEASSHAAAQDFVCLTTLGVAGRPDIWQKHFLSSEYKAEDTIVCIGKDIGRKDEEII